jgi:hypothetical protein
MTVQANPIPFTAIVGTVPQQILPANPNRTFLQLQNKSANTVRIKIGSPFLLAQSSVQTVTYSAPPTAGVFQIKIGPNQTGNLNFNDSNATIQAAVENLASVGVGNVAVTGSFAAGHVYTFQAGKANVAMPIVQILASTLTNNAGQQSAIQTISWSLPPDGGTFIATFGANSTAPLAAATTAAQLLAALNALPSINGGVASVVQNGVSRNFQVTFGAPLANQPLALLQVASSLTNSAPNADYITTLYAEPMPLQGSYQLAFAGGPFAGLATAPIPFGASAADIEDAIEAIPGVGEGQVTVTGANLVSGFTIHFTGTAGMQFLGTLFVYNSTLHPDTLQEPQMRVPGDVVIRLVTSQAGRGTTPVTSSVTSFQNGVAPVPVTTTVAQTVTGQPADTGGIVLQPLGTPNADQLFYDASVPVGQVNAVASASPSALEVWAAP